MEVDFWHCGFCCLGEKMQQNKTKKSVKQVLTMKPDLFGCFISSVLLILFFHNKGESLNSLSCNSLSIL